MLGLDLHSWEQWMLLALGLAALAAVAVGITTTSVVILTRRDSAETKKEYAEYKLTVDGKVADAKKEGLDAGKLAGNALLRAAELEKQAAESKERAFKLELELAKLKQPRLISEDRVKLLAEDLKPFASTPFDLALIPGDPEAAVFGIGVAAMLELAGWKWLPWAPPDGPLQQIFTITGTDKPNIGQFGFFDVMISLKAGDPDNLAPPVKALMELLKAEGFAVAFELSENPNITNKATVHVIVGRKR